MLSEKIEQYISEKVENFKNELKKEVEEMVTNEANKTKTIWDLKKGDEEQYYRLYNNGTIVLTTFESSIDRLFRYLGNAFLTKEEAEFMKERRSIEAIMRKYSRPFKFNKHNYYLVHNHYNESVSIESYGVFNCGVPCFETKEIAQKVIDEIGKDRLKKYWFRVEE